jgi:hypothetical protein
LPSGPRARKAGDDEADFLQFRFQGVADSYRLVAEDTVLGTEIPDARVRGQTVLDVVTCISEGVDRKQKEAKGEGSK